MKGGKARKSKSEQKKSSILSYGISVIEKNKASALAGVSAGRAKRKRVAARNEL